MKFKILTSGLFNKEFKALCKKYASAKDDVSKVISSLQEDPTQGVSLGNNCYKIRIAIKSKTKGKSSGARLITNVCVLNDTIFLLSIFDKSDRANISDKDLQSVLKSLL